MQDAFRVMLESLGSVSEVAYAVGFRNVSHFSQTFE